MPDKMVAVIRTNIAAAVGWLLTLLAENTGVVLSPESTASTISAFQLIATVVYYLLVRVISIKLPWVEYFLGVPVEPKYEKSMRPAGRKPFIGMIALAVAGLGLSGSVIADQPSKGSAKTNHTNSTDQKIEVREASDNFHREVIRAAVKARKAGTIKRRDVLRLRVAMMSPGFRKHAEDLAVIQLSTSGEGKILTGPNRRIVDLPIGTDGRVDRGKIDWEAIAGFLERLIPLILKLIDAFASVELERSYVVHNMDSYAHDSESRVTLGVAA